MNQKPHESDLKRRRKAVLPTIVCVLPIFILYFTFYHLSQHQDDLFSWLAFICLAMTFPGALIAFMLFAARHPQKNG